MCVCCSQITDRTSTMCFLCFLPIHSWTSSSLDVPAGVTQEEGHTGFLIHLLSPSNTPGCQSGTWSQEGTKVNGPDHGDNPLLRQTGIQIATQSLPGPITREHRTTTVRIGLLYLTLDEERQAVTVTSVLCTVLQRKIRAHLDLLNYCCTCIPCSVR